MTEFSFKFGNVLLVGGKPLTAERVVADPINLKVAGIWLKNNWPEGLESVILVDLGTINQMVGDPADPILVDIRLLSESESYKKYEKRSGVYSIGLLEVANEPLPRLAQLLKRHVPFPAEIRLMRTFQVLVSR